MSTDTITPLAPLPDIGDVAPLSAENDTCINEIRDVLRRHGRLQRFGLSLLHEHFVVAEDEILLESCDPVTRTLTITPAKQSALKDVKQIGTHWRLDTMELLAGCRQVCIYTKQGHVGQHQPG